MNDNEYKDMDIDNIVNKPSELDKINDDEKLNKEKKKMVDDWKPNWVRLSMLGATIHSPIEQNGMLVDSSIKIGDGYVDVPENLADDVSRGILDPSKYSREELLKLSIERHNREQSISDMFLDEEKNHDDVIEQNNHYHM